jgi:hypothetical protein
VTEVCVSPIRVESLAARITETRRAPDLSESEVRWRLMMEMNQRGLYTRQLAYGFWGRFVFLHTAGPVFNPPAVTLFSLLVGRVMI